MSPPHWCVVVHVGAGYHAPDKSDRYHGACRQACQVAARVLSAGGDAMTAAVAATRSLEDDPWTNAGVGSVLTECGTIECDAALMDGSDGRFAAVGAVSGVRHPIELASRLLADGKQPCDVDALCRVKPM
jgi:taspase (threonine aspartase 1)